MQHLTVLVYPLSFKQLRKNCNHSNLYETAYQDNNHKLRLRLGS